MFLRMIPDNDSQFLFGEDMNEAEFEDGNGDQDIAHNHPSVNGREVGSVRKRVTGSRVQNNQNQHAHDS